MSSEPDAESAGFCRPRPPACRFYVNCMSFPLQPARWLSTPSSSPLCTRCWGRHRRGWRLTHPRPPSGASLVVKEVAKQTRICGDGTGASTATCRTRPSAVPGRHSAFVAPPLGALRLALGPHLTATRVPCAGAPTSWSQLPSQLLLPSPLLLPRDQQLPPCPLRLRASQRKVPLILLQHLLVRKLNFRLRFRGLVLPSQVGDSNTFHLA